MAALLTIVHSIFHGQTASPGPKLGHRLPFLTRGLFVGTTRWEWLPMAIALAGTLGIGIAIYYLAGLLWRALSKRRATPSATRDPAACSPR